MNRSCVLGHEGEFIKALCRLYDDLPEAMQGGPERRSMVLLALRADLTPLHPTRILQNFRLRRFPLRMFFPSPTLLAKQMHILLLAQQGTPGVPGDQTGAREELEL